MMLLYFLFSLTLTVSHICAEDILVKLPQGELQGLVLTTRSQRRVSGFLGIPYGLPPVEDLRFRSPQPSTAWSGVRNATTYGSPCLQDATDNLLENKTGVLGQEDCLYLNVFTPDTSGNAAVLVFIHGGSFTVGSGHYYAPEYLLDKDIVLVTFNYRLGFLGFLATEDEHAPGNYGLKDQTLALRWVRDNIKHFGGNKNSVTLLGHGAGAASVHYHLLSPLSKGLFNRGISLSGTALCPWAARPPGAHKEFTYRLAAMVGCNVEDSTQLTVECLRDIPPYILTQLMQELKGFGNEPRVLFPPAVEMKNITDSFSSVDPWAHSSSTPWLTGITADNGIDGSGIFMKGKENEELMSELNDQFEGFAPDVLGFRETAVNPQRISRSIRKFYFGPNEIWNETMRELTEMFTDANYLHCSEEAVRRHSGPTYKYYYNYLGSKTLFPTTSGVRHFDEMFYLFPFPTLNKENTTVEEDLFGKMFLEFITNFATFGNPTPKGSTIQWDPVTSAANEYLYIDNETQKMQKKLKSKRDKFWQNLEFRNKPKSLFRRPPEKNDEL